MAPGPQSQREVEALAMAYSRLGSRQNEFLIKHEEMALVIEVSMKGWTSLQCVDYNTGSMILN